MQYKPMFMSPVSSEVINTLMVNTAHGIDDDITKKTTEHMAEVIADRKPI